ncbi:methionine--tRNA ligase [Sarracenia purpurea var. burkii]
MCGVEMDSLRPIGFIVVGILIELVQRPSKSAAVVKLKASAEAEISISRLDIRVALITRAQKHPDADSLYVEEIDVGESQLRTVVSGLVKYIPLEDMQNRKVCVLCNLKPATMRGIKSQAMVLAASSTDHTKVELVEPPQSVPVGERVTFPGFKGDPHDVLNPKKKVWETVQVHLHTDKELVACYKDVPFTTSAGVCKLSSISDGSIR